MLFPDTIERDLLYQGGGTMSDRELTYTTAEELKTVNEGVIAEFRANGGRVGGPLTGTPLLLLTTTGAKTGRPRTTPITYTTDNGRLVFTASREEDATRHPDWYHNILANPNVVVEMGTETFPARATVLEGSERQRLFDQIAAQVPPEFAGYLRNTHLQIPVIALDRVG
jgi:deazaflavin-dependent oxidoreductase (nitroreductase family)